MVKIFRCERCGHIWLARPKRWKFDGPKRCPKCWSRGLTEQIISGKQLEEVTAKAKEVS